MNNQIDHSFSWFCPTRVIFGNGEVSSLERVITELAGSQSKVFLVTGRQSLSTNGFLDRIVDSIGTERVTLFDKVLPFPTPDLVDKATLECKQALADIVVAVGGGSALDLGKAVAMIVTHDGKAEDFAQYKKQFERPGIPFVAVPTTSGSSSEVTRFTALWDMESKRSFSLGNSKMFPEVAIVDPNLSMTMPKSLAAVTGFDAFTSAFESYWSLNAQPIADALNLEVIRLFTAHLEQSCNEGDLRSRSACALAANLSGMAYSNAFPNACHGIGTSLTLHWNVSHGQAVSITLPALLRSVGPAIDHKLPALFDAMGVGGIEEAATSITEMMERCGLQTRLRGLGILKEDIDILMGSIRWDRLSELPRQVDKPEIREMVSGLL